MVNRFDLMLGDWVFLKGTPVQISRLLPEGFTTNTFFGDNDKIVYKYEDAEPIVITQQLLIDNGWGTDMYAYYEINDCAYLDYYYHEHRLRRFYHKGLHSQKESQNSRELTFQCHCSYLHELQHAAKMCGIELEFKVIKNYDEI